MDSKPETSEKQATKASSAPRPNRDDLAQSLDSDTSDPYAYMAETALLFAAYTPLCLLGLFVANLMRIRFPREKAAVLADLLLVYGPPVTLATAIILGAVVANARKSIGGAVAFWFSVVMLVVWINAAAYLGVFD